MIKQVLLLLACSLSLVAGAQDLSFYAVSDLDDYQQVLTQAIEEDQMIFVVLYEENGDFENMVREGQWQDSALYSAYDSLINIALQVNSDMGSRFVELFGARDIPSFYFLTSEELLVNVLSGAQNTEQLKTALPEAKKAAEKWAKLKTKYTNNQLSKSEFLEFLKIYELNFSLEQAQQVVTPFLNSLSREEKFSKTYRPLMLRYGYDLEGPYPEMIMANREKFDSAAFEDYIEQAYSYNFDRAVANEDSLLLLQVIEVLVPASGTDSTTREMTYETKKLFAIETENFSAWAEAAEERSSTMESDSAKAEFLYSAAFAIADNFNTDQSQRAALKLANRSNLFQKNYRALMLEAYMLYLREVYDTALKRVDEAATLAEESQQNNVRKLRKMIENELPEQEEKEE